MNIQVVKIKDIKSNPNNPRVIKDDKFHKLCESIKAFPKMLELRPIVVNDDMIVLGGNMRLKALKHLGLTEAPVIKASDLTEDQQRQFIIKDNAGFGEWDWDMLANEWDVQELESWGIDLPIRMEEPTMDELIGDEKNKPPTMKITFDNVEQLQKAEIEIQELLDRKYEGAYFSISAGEI
jgi:hypothetical protein